MCVNMNDVQRNKDIKNNNTKSKKNKKYFYMYIKQ